MTELSRAARSVLQQARTSLTPGRDEREAVCKAVEARAAADAVAQTAVAQTTEAPRASAVASSTGVVFRWFAVGVLVVAGSLVIVRSMRQSAPRWPETAAPNASVVRRVGDEPIEVDPTDAHGSQAAQTSTSRAALQVPDPASRVNSRSKPVDSPAKRPPSRRPHAQLSAATNRSVPGAATHVATPPEAALAHDISHGSRADVASVKIVNETSRAVVSEREPPAERAQPATDTLVEELRLLRSAQAALDRGDGAAALLLLERHTMRYPKGVLRQERLAARVSALCMLGRIDEAVTTVRQLTSIAPSSPHLTRLRTSCIRDARQ